MGCVSTRHKNLDVVDFCFADHSDVRCYSCKFDSVRCEPVGPPDHGPFSWLSTYAHGIDT
jgi:hypothetical protein